MWSGWNFPAWCSGGRRPLIAGCLSLQRLGIDLPVTHPAWDSNISLMHFRYYLRACSRLGSCRQGELRARLLQKLDPNILLLATSQRLRRSDRIDPHKRNSTSTLLRRSVSFLGQVSELPARNGRELRGCPNRYHPNPVRIQVGSHRALVSFLRAHGRTRWKCPMLGDFHRKS